MQEKGNVPAVRFVGFTDDWERRKLDDMSHSFEYGLNAAATIFDGKNKYIRITDIDDETRLFLMTDLTSPDVDLSTAGNYLLQEGDIVFARTGASVGKTYIYKPSDGVMYYAGFLIRVRIKPEYCADFVFQNTLTERYKRFISITSQRSGQPGVNAQEYSTFVFPVPEYGEQQKIGAFFRHLDHLITLHQRKYSRLCNIKKSMLEKMFPGEGATIPEIRFAGFTDDWEQRKIGDLTNVLSASRVHKDEWETEGVPFFRSSDVVAAFKGTDNEKAFISRKLYEELVKSSGKLEQDDILITGGGSIGIPYIVPNNEPLYSKDADLIWMKHSEYFDSRFMFAYFTGPNFRGYIGGISHVGTIAHYTIEQVKDTPVLMPSINEQKKLGDFFCFFDHLLNFHQCELERLQNIKKACLEKMFV